MAEKGYVLNDADLAVIRRVVEQVNSQLGNTPGRGREGVVEHEEHQAPEVYVARVLEGGIPAATWNACESAGTGSAGTGTAESGYVPGSATCSVYRLRPGEAVAAGLSRKVYNLGTSAIAECSLVLIVRDKFGRWVAIQTAGGDGSLWALPYRRGMSLSGCNLYSWHQQREAADCAFTSGPNGGTAGAWVEVEKTGEVGESDDGPGETWSVSVNDATSGQYMLNVDGDDTDWIEHDGDASAALIAAGGNLASGTLTFNDTAAHSIRWVASRLRPGPHNPLKDVNNAEVSDFKIERAWPGFQAQAEIAVTAADIGTGTGGGSGTSYEVRLRNVGGGTYPLVVTIGMAETPVGPVEWDATADEVQDALDDALGPGWTVSGWTRDGDNALHYVVSTVGTVFGLEAGAGDLEGVSDYRMLAGGAASPDDPDTTNWNCARIFDDYDIDPDTCVPTKTYKWIKVPPGGGPFDSEAACLAAGGT